MLTETETTSTGSTQQPGRTADYADLTKRLVNDVLADAGRGKTAVAYSGWRDIFGWVRDVEEVIKTELPSLNRTAETNPDRVQDLIDRFRPLLTAPELQKLSSSTYVDKRFAREIIGLTSWLAASVETHLRRRGGKPGDGYRIFAGLEDALLALGVFGKHPPTHSHLTYWRYNDFNLPRTFTGTPGEIHFNRAVNGTDRLKTLVCEEITPLATGEIDLDNPEAMIRLERARAAYDEIQGLFADYKRAPAEGCPVRMPQKAFMTGMRPYLVATQIGGLPYTGPNAANVLSWVETDFRIGFAEPFYTEMVRQRYPTMAEEEPARAEAFMASSPVSAVVARWLGLDADAVGSTELKELIARCGMLPTNVRSAIKAFAALARAARTTSHVHFSWIQFYVEQAGAKLDADERRAALVQAGKGVSGTPVEEGAARVAKMRKENLTICKLTDLGKAI